MRKTLIMALIAATAIPGMAQAQSAGEIRRDNRAIHEERQELRQAQLHGSRADVREERRDLRDAQRERREDWRDYRQAHRDVYRRPAYVGPRGWRYRPVTVGYRFEPHYYGAQYVIADPWRYRLPRPAGYNRWVRYGNDVVLVNARTGRVVQVYNGFFF